MFILKPLVMKKKSLALFTFGALSGPAIAVLWHLGRHELRYSAGLDATSQLILYCGMVFIVNGLFYFLISQHKVERKTLCYAAKSTIWAFLASIPIAIFAHGPDLVQARGTDPRAYTQKRVEILHSQEMFKHMPKTSNNYEISAISLQNQFIQAGGHITLEAMYITDAAFIAERNRLISLQYLPSEGSCGLRTRREILSELGNGKAYGYGAKISGIGKDINGYSEMYFIYDKYGEQKHDKNASTETGSTEGCYWNHGGVSYALVNPKEKKIIYSADFW